MDKILVTQPSLPEIDEYIKEIKDIWETKWLTNMGPKHNVFETGLKNYLEVEHLQLLTNGHMALELTMQAMGLTGQVITTPFTFASTTHAIVRNGLTPVFCDINSYDFTIDTQKLESLITENTSAILPVHVYGNICDVEAIEKIAMKYNLRVIYDAAHTFGIKYNNIGIGNFGDASCFSFHATKVFHSIEGGAVTFRDEKLGKEIYRLKNFGIRDAETVDGVGANAKMNEFCAAMGICNLRHIEDDITKRKRLAERYRERLGAVQGIQLSPMKEGVSSNYAYFPIVISREVFGVDRNYIFAELERNGILARKYFYPLTNEFDCYKGMFDVTKTPVALQISQSVLTLPIYSSLELDVVDKVCDIILKCQR